MLSIMSRIADSYAEQQGLWEKRVAAGQQPNLPCTSITFLTYANIFYLGLTFVLHRYMKARPEPFKCKPFKSILLVYNLSCVVLAGYVVWGIGSMLLKGHFSFVGNTTVIPGSPEDDGNAAFLAHVFWVFYAQKFWEFLDTWFFILRKSFRQVTFLHVFHHCSINIVVGLVLPFEFNGDMYLPIFLNAVVHVLMYSHYLVAALGLSTPWKPYLTSMQLLQFCLIAAQSGISLYRGDSCGGPYFGKLLLVAYMGSMLVLFGNFFFNSYILKKPDTKFGGGVVMKPPPLQITKSHTGRSSLDANGTARVEMPSSFSGGEVCYQLTAVGMPMPNLHICREVTPEDTSFELAGGAANMAVSWTVTMVVNLLGERKPKPTSFFTCCDRDDPQLCCNPQDAESKTKKET